MVLKSYNSLLNFSVYGTLEFSGCQGFRIDAGRRCLPLGYMLCHFLRAIFDETWFLDDGIFRAPCESACRRNLEVFLSLVKNSEILYLFLASVDVLTFRGRSCSNCVLKETAQFFTCRAWLTRNPLPSSPAEICKERAAVIVLVTIIYLLFTYIRAILEWANRE